MSTHVYLIPMTALYIHLKYCYTCIIMYIIHLLYYVLWTMLFRFLNDLSVPSHVLMKLKIQYKMKELWDLIHFKGLSQLDRDFLVCNILLCLQYKIKIKCILIWHISCQRWQQFICFYHKVRYWKDK
jgi:hypothetical protein